MRHDDERTPAPNAPRPWRLGATVGVLLLVPSACAELEPPLGPDCGLDTFAAATDASPFPPDRVAVPVADVRERILPTLGQSADIQALTAALDEMGEALSSGNPESACAAYNEAAHLAAELGAVAEPGSGMQAEIEVVRLTLDAAEASLRSLAED